MDALHKRLAQNIRARARALGIPLTHLADRAGVSRANLWTVLNGGNSPTLKWMAKVADALDCDAAELVAKTPRASK
ncbi:MAG TPA: helix-turn-helix transcriptional regulator [Polyangia bacterium]|nr:helix-turn-helix transcriptional regulator [Polyangia bacterium]